MSKKSDDTFRLSTVEVLAFDPNAINDFAKPRAAFVEVYDWGPSMTRQEFAADCDINTIMERYEVTGVIHAPFQKPDMAFMDVTDAPDLMTALKMLEDAKTSFMLLPAVVRREFDNDPVQYVAFAQDPANLDQMREWGLAPPAPAERPPVADRPLTELTASEFVQATGGAPKPA